MEQDFEAPSSYQRLADLAAARLLEWCKAKGLVALPGDAGDLPRSCPIWEMGVSLAQADYALAAVKQSLMEEVYAHGGSFFHRPESGPAAGAP